VGGTVTGLSSGASLTLQNNNTDNLTISADQGFTFTASLTDGQAYDVTVLTQPVGQACTVGNGTGVIDSQGTDITIVTVTCALTSSVGGTVAGLAPGDSVWLQSNGQTLPIAANGSFAFAGILPAGSNYNVTIAIQPAQQTCVLANAAGVVSASAMAQVSIVCS
jgi:hypothetical protein